MKPKGHISQLALVASLAAGTSLIGASAALAKDYKSANGEFQVAQVSGIQVPSAPSAAQAGAYQASQERRGQTVRERPRPDYDAKGILFGGLVFTPELRIQEEYNDNIFADENNEESDFITKIRPRIVGRDDEGLHRFRVSGEADIGIYADNDDENYEDYAFAGGYRYGTPEFILLFLDAGYRQSHENRGSPDDVNGVEPTEFDTTSASIAIERGVRRLKLRLSGTYDELDFDDVQTSVGTTINNDDRDRTVYGANAQVTFEFSENYKPFVRGGWNKREYDSALDDNGFNRDSDGYTVVGGVELDFGGVTFGEFYAGYLSQSYDDARLSEADGYTAGATIYWNPTGLTSVTFDADRTVQETTVVDGATAATATLDNSVGIRVDHEFLRNLIASLEGNYLRRNFEGIGRTDDEYQVGVSARYLLNQYFEAGLSYRHRTRNSDLATVEEFGQNIVRIEIVGKL